MRDTKQYSVGENERTFALYYIALSTVCQCNQVNELREAKLEFLYCSLHHNHFSLIRTTQRLKQRFKTSTNVLLYLSNQHVVSVPKHIEQTSTLFCCCKVRIGTAPSRVNGNLVYLNCSAFSTFSNNMVSTEKPFVISVALTKHENSYT